MAHATNDLSAIQQTAGLGVLTFVDSLFNRGICHPCDGIYNKLEINLDLFNPHAFYGLADKLVWNDAAPNLS